jgi:hypothetical protein
MIEPLSSKNQLSRWRVFLNGTAYMGMGEVKPDGSAGPNLRAWDCDFVVASEADAEIERLRQELGETKIRLVAESFALECAGRNYAILEDNAKRLRAALERIALGSACDDPACTSMFHEGCDAVTDKDQRYKAIARRTLGMEAVPRDKSPHNALGCPACESSSADETTDGQA